MDKGVTRISIAPSLSGAETIDVTAPQHEVEVLYRNHVLWVNIDGICRLRCCQMQNAALIFDIRHEAEKSDAQNAERFDDQNNL